METQSEDLQMPGACASISFPATVSCSPVVSPQSSIGDCDPYLSDASLIEEEVELYEDGEQMSERVLIPHVTCLIQNEPQESCARSTTSCSSQDALFSVTLTKIKSETLLKESTHGPEVLQILEHMERHIHTVQTVNILATLHSILDSCLQAGEKGKLTSVKAGHIWSKFHQVRTDTKLVQQWNDYLQAISLSPSLQVRSNMCLQLLLDRMLKAEISLKRDEMLSQERPQSSVTDHELSEREKNVVRYMTGYIPAKLLKKFKKRSPNSYVQQKRKYFVRVLQEMRADNQPETESFDSVEDYTCKWSELIDRGGLFHVKHKAYKLVERIEIVTRKHLNIKNLEILQQGDIHDKLVKEVLDDPYVIQHWEAISFEIPPRYEFYSLELLEIIVKLWCTVRCYSFTTGCNILFGSSKQHGTRRGLKAKGTEKECT